MTRIMNNKIFKQNESQEDFALDCTANSKIEIGMSMKNFDLLRDISLIRKNLFLSGFGCITRKMLRNHGVTHVVDATNIRNNPRYEDIEYMCVRVDDSPLADLKSYFEVVAQFVKQAMDQGGKVLIYCAAGISRSASLCMMCLVINENLSLQAAYQCVCERRPIISPNIAFWRQMIEYEREKRGGEASVRLLNGMSRPIPDVYINEHKSDQ